MALELIFIFLEAVGYGFLALAALLLYVRQKYLNLVKSCMSSGENLTKGHIERIKKEAIRYGKLNAFGTTEIGDEFCVHVPRHFKEGQVVNLMPIKEKDRGGFLPVVDKENNYLLWTKGVLVKCL